MVSIQKKILPAIFLVLAFALTLATPSMAKTHSKPAQTVWTGSWAASQQIPEPANALPPDDLRDATLRQIVHLSLGGSTLRVHLSNAFGTEPLRFTSVHIAQPLSPAAAQIDPATDRALTFSGSPDVIVPAGAEYISDPIDYTVAPLSSLAITFHLDQPPAQQTGHPGSRATSYLVHGDQVSAADLPDAKKIDHWYQLAEVDVAAPPGAAAIVTLGDSITDGHAATTNGNDRWPDVLAARLQAPRQPASSASSIKASEAIISSPTASAPTPSPASTATSSPNPARSTSSSSKASTTSAASPASPKSASRSTTPSSIASSTRTGRSSSAPTPARSR